MKTPHFAARIEDDADPRVAYHRDMETVSRVRAATLPSRVLREASERELALFAAGAALFIAGEVILTHATTLLGRYLWLDEHVTSLIVSDPSIFHSIQAVKGGVDTNPPVYHLLLRAFMSATGMHGPSAYRVFSLLCVWLMLVAVYGVMRRALGVLAAIVGALFVWSHPLVVIQAFEARFYGPLLVATALFCFVFCRARSHALNATFVALASVFLCTIHYFGILSLGAVVLGDLLAARETWRESARRLLPVAAGPVALFAFMPFLRVQSAGLSVPTWVEPFSIAGAGKFFESLFRALGLPIVVMVWWVSEVIRSREASSDSGSQPRLPIFPLRPLAGLSALLLVPFGLIAFSATVLPVLVPRYLVTAILALAAPVSLLAERTRRPLAVCASVTLAALSFFDIRHYAQSQRQWQHDQQEMVEAARGSPDDGLPIVAFARLEAYMICQAAPELASRVRILDLRPTHREKLSRYIIFESDMEQKVRRFYDVPPLTTLEELGKLGRFHLVPPQPGDVVDVPPIQALPVRQVEPSIFETNVAARAKN